MPDKQMVGLYDYMEGFLAAPSLEAPLQALHGNGSEPDVWPVNVYAVDDTFIDVAYSKEQFISIWNSSAINRAIGTLSGWYGPYEFLLTYRKGALTPYFLGVGGFVIIIPPSEHRIFSKTFAKQFA